MLAPTSVLKDSPVPKPTITVFHIAQGKLRIGRGNGVTKGSGGHIRTMGWFEGSDITSGDPFNGQYGDKVYDVTITAHGGKKVWKGWIIGYAIGGEHQRGQWTFLVINEKNEADPDQGDSTITVTVTNPDTGESTTTTPPPQSPAITLAEVP